MAAPAYLAKTSKADTAVWGALSPAFLRLLPTCVLSRPLLHLPRAGCLYLRSPPLQLLGKHASLSPNPLNHPTQSLCPWL